jgi:hypothetical protein
MSRILFDMRELMQQHGVAIVLGAFGLGIFLIILAISTSVARGRRRNSQIRDWAFRNGYQYEAGPVPARELAPIAQFAIDDKTSSADAFNVARGSKFTLADLRRTSVQHFGAYGNNTQHTTRTVSCALTKLGTPLPPFSFSALTMQGPDTLQGKLMGGVISLAKFAGAKAGVVMVEIENRPGFLLTSPQADAMQPLFASGRAQFFDDKCGWSVECDGSWLLVVCDPAIYGAGKGWSRTGLVDAEHFDEFATIARSIHEHFAERRDEFAG